MVQSVTWAGRHWRTRPAGAEVWGCGDTGRGWGTPSAWWDVRMVSGWCQDGVKMVSRWCQDCDKGWCLEDRRLANDQRHVSESEPRHVTGLCRTDCGHRTLAGVGSVVSLIAGGSCATFPADIALVPRYLAGIQIINHCSNYQVKNHDLNERFRLY